MSESAWEFTFKHRCCDCDGQIKPGNWREWRHGTPEPLCIRCYRCQRCAERRQASNAPIGSVER